MGRGGVTGLGGRRGRVWGSEGKGRGDRREKGKRGRVGDRIMKGGG